VTKVVCVEHNRGHDYVRGNVLKMLFYYEIYIQVLVGCRVKLQAQPGIVDTTGNVEKICHKTTDISYPYLFMFVGVCPSSKQTNETMF